MASRAHCIAHYLLVSFILDYFASPLLLLDYLDCILVSVHVQVLILARR